MKRGSSEQNFDRLTELLEEKQKVVSNRITAGKVDQHRCSAQPSRNRPELIRATGIVV